MKDPCTLWRASLVGGTQTKACEPGTRTCTDTLLRSSVMPLILSAWVKSEGRGRSNREEGDYEGLVDVGMREHVATMNTCLSISNPPAPTPVLNVKCLTARLSEEELQRAAAPLEPGGWGRGWGGSECRGSRSLPGFFGSCLMQRSHCHSVLK